MFYTNRRANLQQTDRVDWVHGTPIGIAESIDGGVTWTYRGDVHIHYRDKDYTYWAPDMIENDVWLLITGTERFITKGTNLYILISNKKR